MLLFIAIIEIVGYISLLVALFGCKPPALPHRSVHFRAQSFDVNTSNAHPFAWPITSGRRHAFRMAAASVSAAATGSARPDDVHMDAPAHKRSKSQSNLAIVQIDQIRMGRKEAAISILFDKVCSHSNSRSCAPFAPRPQSPLRAFHGAQHNIQWGGISKQCQNKN